MHILAFLTQLFFFFFHFRSQNAIASINGVCIFWKPRLITSRMSLRPARSLIRWVSQAVRTVKDVIVERFYIPDFDLDLDLTDAVPGSSKVCVGCDGLVSPSYNTGWKFLRQGAELGCQICRTITTGLSNYPNAPPMDDRSFISISVTKGAPVLLWLTNCRYAELYTRPGIV